MCYLFAGVNLSSWPEIGSDGDVLLMPYVPKGITGYDDDDDDDDLSAGNSYLSRCTL
jgi:hypothetical protein